MASIKVEFRTHGNESRPADFQLTLKRADLKKVASMEPEEKRQLYQYLKNVSMYLTGTKMKFKGRWKVE